MTEIEVVNFLNKQYTENNIDIRDYSINEMIENPEIKVFLKDLIFYSAIEEFKTKRPEVLDTPFKNICNSDLVAIGMSTSQHLNNMANIIKLNN